MGSQGPQIQHHLPDSLPESFRCDILPSLALFEVPSWPFWGSSGAWPKLTFSPFGGTTAPRVLPQGPPGRPHGPHGCSIGSGTAPSKHCIQDWITYSIQYWIQCLLDSVLDPILHPWGSLEDPWRSLGGPWRLPGRRSWVPNWDPGLVRH